ncbi:MAG: hypothetical protein A2Y64_04570 [Candidatus Coatesbacteria bacterium RBG_13_66_14]|uniref:ThuA-like domain-containing protein n=1 Tax=Candidatus Coatesbacteria bacterium RBG_13_66_14 TaxID=1817816 RepID=A0A1F5FAV4_9BACT|nr:MAG: hypothetical protein A2Y64_04570 [Candidatus Coatesbacteria bacterium RBG_13_66_14]
MLFIGFTTAGAVDLLLVDDNSWDGPEGLPNYANMERVEDILDAMGIPFYHEWNNRHRFPGITADLDYLNNYHIMIWYNDNRAIDQTEYDAVRAWVEEGNYLIVTGYDSLGNPNDPIMAQLVGSSTYGDYPFCDSFSVGNDDNFIMDGDWGYFAAGTSYGILPDATDHDWAQPVPGTRKIATAYFGHVQGPAKILLTENVGDGGIIVYWNGNWDSIEWWRTSQTMDTVNMFRNLMDYLVELVSVEETSWGGIKGIFTP